MWIPSALHFLFNAVYFKVISLQSIVKDYRNEVPRCLEKSKKYGKNEN